RFVVIVVVRLDRLSAVFVRSGLSAFLTDARTLKQAHFYSDIYHPAGGYPRLSMILVEALENAQRNPFVAQLDRLRSLVRRKVIKNSFVVNLAHNASLSGSAIASTFSMSILSSTSK